VLVVVTMQPVSVLKPGFGPTLPQLVGGLPRPVRVAALAFAALLVLAAAALAVSLRPEEMNVIVRGPATFNVTYGPQLERVTVPGALLALRRERNGLFLDSYVVRPLDLPPYRGAAGGVLPVYAVHYLDELRERYGPLQVAADGRTRINNGIGHQLVLRARRDGRTLYVRHLLLVPDAPEGARRGVVVEIESTPAAGTPNAVGVGNAGPLKQAMRSFRFGTERKGGTQ
jgi:hypothetical protein